jgi:hypothetical protein
MEADVEGTCRTHCRDEKYVGYIILVGRNGRDETA